MKNIGLVTIIVKEVFLKALKKTQGYVSIALRTDYTLTIERVFLLLAT
jgi:hypothetical protein